MDKGIDLIYRLCLRGWKITSVIDNVVYIRPKNNLLQDVDVIVEIGRRIEIGRRYDTGGKLVCGTNAM